LNASQHVREVRAKFPELKLVLNYRWLIIWEGELRSFAASYRIRLFWHRWWREDWAQRKRRLRILVLDPPLEDLNDRRIPHVYRYGEQILPCVYDPDNDDDWNPSLSIAETIIPYIIQWLCSYEIWKITGDWPAPGRHPEIPADWKPNDLAAPLERSIGAAFVKVGLRMGTFVSSALMGVASGESFPWLSSQHWKTASFEENR
jgi:hypothetical protein